MKKYLLILLAIALVASACSAKNEKVPTSLIGSWKLISYGPANSPIPAVADAKAGFTFNEDGTVTGNSGCNSLGGHYTVKGNQIAFSQIISTLIGCNDVRMAQERLVQKVLTGTATFKVEGSTLTLANNSTVLVLTR